MAKEAETKKAADKNSPAPGESFSKIEDELEDDDDLEEEDDDEDDEAHARSLRPAAHPHGHAAAHGRSDETADASWWVPHAILGTLVLVGVLGFFGAFTSLLGPSWQKVKRTPTATSSSASAAPSAAPAATAPVKPSARPPVARPTAPMTAKPIDPNPSFGARRILVTYKGAKNSKEDKRTKEDAKKRADEAAKKLAGGAKFEEVAGEFSDEAGAKGTGGNMGRFKRDAFDPVIIAEVEKLKVGATSAVFESPFGYEILMRLE